MTKILQTSRARSYDTKSLINEKLIVFAVLSETVSPAERPFRLKSRSKTPALVAPPALRLWILILETSLSPLKSSDAVLSVLNE